MISEQHAMIYLSSQRGCTQSDWFRTYHSLNFGSYYNKHRTPFHHLNALNDETLKASTTISHPALNDSSILLLPIVGGIEYAVDNNDRSFVEAGECVLVNVPGGSVIHISNPYEYEVVNYVHVWFAGNDELHEGKFEIDLPGHQNSVLRLFGNDTTQAHIGRFSAREDSTFHSDKEPPHVFVFVVEGAFEFQNRLLEARDCLALSNVSTSDFEALSNDAILLILEV